MGGEPIDTMWYQCGYDLAKWLKFECETCALFWFGGMSARPLFSVSAPVYINDVLERIRDASSWYFDVNLDLGVNSTSPSTLNPLGHLWQGMWNCCDNW